MGKRDTIKERILELLETHHVLSTADVGKALKLSESSLRRYFTELEQNGQLLRVHGGIRLPVEPQIPGYVYSQEAESHKEEKLKIGNYAVRLIDPGDGIFFDSGSTNAECTRCLADYLGENPMPSLRVVTTSMVCSATLARRCSVVVTGGCLRPDRMDFSGCLALDTLKNYFFNKAFLGADGIDAEGNLCTTDEETAAIARLAIEHSTRCFVLADSSKLGKQAFVPYASLLQKKITLITDGNANGELLDKMRIKGIDILIV